MIRDDLDVRQAALAAHNAPLRKAQGVYYTPPVLVDHILRHTLGPLLAGRTPAQIAGLRLIDPACGSGVFLLAAYQFLLDWYQQRSGRHLTPDERTGILLRHID